MSRAHTSKKKKKALLSFGGLSFYHLSQECEHKSNYDKPLDFFWGEEGEKMRKRSNKS